MIFKQILLLLTLTNLIALGIIGYQKSYIFPHDSISERITQASSLHMEFPPRKFIYQKHYNFTNASLANKILRRLDKPETIELANSKYNESFYGLKSDNKYCDKHRRFFTRNADALFKEMSFFTDASVDSLLRGGVLSMQGKDLHPEVGPRMLKKKREGFDNEIQPETSLFLTADNMFEYKKIGKEFSCVSQVSNHIPEIGKNNTEGLAPFTKNSIVGYLNKYSKRFSDKLECFNLDKFRPNVWDLSNKKQCEDFFAKLQDKDERNPDVFMKRKAVKSNGEEQFELINELEEQRLLTLYQDKKICGVRKSTEKHIIHKYVHNPMLLNGRKFNIRAYMLVASTNPVIAYYHDGHLSVSPSVFKGDNSLVDGLLGEEGKNKKTIYMNGLNKKEAGKAEIWTFERLQGYLLEKGKVKNRDWANENLRLKLQTAMIHVLRAISGNFARASSLYELFAFDFIMDEEMNLWFLDAKHKDLFTGRIEGNNGEAIVRMLEDHLEIVVGLMRSRVKRVVNYVNRLIRDDLVSENPEGRLKLVNETQRKLEFQEITKNYFDSDYLPKKTNGFKKIMDENYYSFQRYNLIIERECLI